MTLAEKIIKKSENIRFKRIERDKKLVKSLTKKNIKQYAKLGWTYLYLNYENVTSNHNLFISPEEACKVAFDYLISQGFKVTKSNISPKTELRVSFMIDEEEPKW